MNQKQKDETRTTTVQLHWLALVQSRLNDHTSFQTSETSFHPNINIYESWQKIKKQKIKFKEVVIRKVLGKNPNIVLAQIDGRCYPFESSAVLGMIPIYFATVHQATLLKQILQKMSLFYVSFHVDVGCCCGCCLFLYKVAVSSLFTIHYCLLYIAVHMDLAAGFFLMVFNLQEELFFQSFAALVTLAFEAQERHFRNISIVFSRNISNLTRCYPLL